MKCRDVKKELPTLIADGRQNSLPEPCAAHLQTCDSCRNEWKRLTGWGRMLASKEKWTPEEGFFERLVETGMREKRRAVLTESVAREMDAQPFNLLEFLRRPLHLPRMVPATLLITVFLIPIYFFISQQWNTIGNFDYAFGSVFAHSTSRMDADKGNAIVKGTGIQTAQGAESIVKLKGGTEILISSLSRIAIDDARTVHLEHGKAFFDVLKGQGQFKIHVPDGEILVLGTAFAVEVNPEGTIVTVTRGSVQISGANQSQKINGGYEGILRRNTPPVMREAQLLQQTHRWVGSLRNRRSEEELLKYYPSLAVKPTPVNR
ncbi:MAG: hypothetical protein C4527_10075 [Candidatus Omnitrophota bacterium]|jgi:hypothetical protein|nr:MAG: hypothetical protein C4527_10075 [Candidatus Omnitrophota bacterium]